MNLPISPLFEEEFGTLEIYNHRPCLIGFEVKQIHSNIIRNVDQDSKLEEMPEGDGMVVYRKNFPKGNYPSLAVKTADCVPVFIWGSEGYALIHAGWRGIQSKICFQDNIAKIKPAFAYLAPHICQIHYPVGDEFLDYFDSRSFKKLSTQSHFSQKDQLLLDFSVHYPNIKISSSERCTYEDVRLQSYRRDKMKKSNYTFFIPTNG